MAIVNQTRHSQKGEKMAANATANVKADDTEWVDVATETQMVFDTDGDVFIGRFLGWSETDKGIPQAHFENADGKFFVNCGWSLKTQLKQVKTGTMTRITRTGLMDTGQDSPMVVFRVQTKK